MKVYILTLFPEMFSGVFQKSILKRALDKKLLEINLINIRDFATNRHKTVDDTPYGGGRGMILKVDIVIKALESIKPKPYSILLSAGGKKFNQHMAKQFSGKNSLALICGHYEGVDVRVEKFVDTVITVGDFVLTGGEIAAMAIVDSTTRLIPGVIHPDSLKTESFTRSINHQPSTINLLEYPQYTKPTDFRGLKVPKVLISGNHQQIEKWRKEASQKVTRKYRKDLLLSITGK